jgi:hypothetical protein
MEFVTSARTRRTVLEIAASLEDDRLTAGDGYDIACAFTSHPGVGHPPGMADFAIAKSTKRPND